MFGSVVIEYVLEVPLGCVTVKECVVLITVGVTLTPRVVFDSVML